MFFSDKSAKLKAINKSSAVIEFKLDGTIITANENFLNVMGYTLKEIKGKHHSMFAEPGYANSAEYQQFWASLRKGELQVAQYKRFGKGGREVWIQASYNPLIGITGKPYKIVKYATDITEQKFHEADSEGQINAIGKSQAVIHFDLNGTILSANENFLNAMGYSLSEIKGQHHSMFAESHYAASAEYKEFWAKLKRGEFEAGQYKRLGKGGKEIWIQASYNPIFDMSGKPFKVVKFATDITQQKLQEADTSGQIKAIGKSQAVIEFNMDGTITNANSNFLSVTGYNIEEIRGQHHSMFVEPSYAAGTEYKQFWDKLNQGEFEAGQYKRFGKSGEEIWIQASYNPIFDMNGRPFKVVKYATDITKQKLNEADTGGQIEAIGKSQAVIHFNLDGTIITANKNFLDTMGYSFDEIQGKHHSMFADRRFADSAEYKEFWQKLRRGEFEAGQYKRFGKGGKEIWIQASYNPIFDVNGKPFKVVKFATDITQQKIYEADSSGQIDAIGKSQAVIEFNMDGTILKANDNFLSVTGYTLSEIQGKHHSMFAENAYAKSSEYREFWEKLNRGVFEQGEYKRVAKGGAEFWIQASYNPILDMNGKPFKVVKYATDITEMVVARIENEQGMNEAVAVLTNIANGDLSKKMELEYKGTFAKIKDAVNETLKHLTAITGRVQLAAREISTSSREISEGSKDLSQRTETQATSLQETAASMEQMAATVQNNANNAAHANTLADNAKEAATSGGTIVENAIKAMSKIESSSQKIADITSVIDEIAFQINLLALNAAVEAARAGEAGKGFEVVAAEVRKLAQRSASAAKDIDNLISESGEEVHQGATLVKETGDSLEGIVNSIVRLVDIVGEITSATKEQATGIEQINQEVSNMDNMTQQNTALVEENSATCQNLQERASEMLELISFFRSEAQGASLKAGGDNTPIDVASFKRALAS